MADDAGVELPFAEVRAKRQSLRAEILRVNHWCYLVRAQMDLMIASLVPPDEISSEPDSLPDHATMLGYITQERMGVDLEHLQRLRDLERKLNAYARSLEHALDYSAEEVVRCLVPDPAAGLWLSTAAYSWNA